MASEKRVWSFKANSEQDAALRSYMGETEDRTKTDALAHYVNEGIRREQEQDPGPSSLPTILLNGVVQMSVLAIIILMMGPGLNIVRARTATYVGVGLLALAFWLLMAIHYNWIDRIQHAVRGHLQWAKREAEA